MNILDKLKAVFSAVLPQGDDASAAPSTSIQYSFASLTELNALIGEQRRMAGLKRGQNAQGESLKAEIAELDRQRIELLTEALVAEDAEKSTGADELAARIGEKRQQLVDIEQVNAGIERKIEALNERRDNLKMTYLRDLGQFMNGIFGELAVEYNQKAAELSEVVLQIAALQQVMKLYQAGNSNGFSRRVYLPLITPGDARATTPILDGDSVSFRDGANGFQELIKRQLAEAGFNHRFD